MRRWITGILAATTIFCAPNALHANEETPTVTRVVDGEFPYLSEEGTQSEANTTLREAL